MHSLFIIDSDHHDVSSDISAISKAKAGGRVTVIGLDFWSKKKLREAGISYRSPVEYLELDKAMDIDRRAVEIARTWHQPFRSELTYKGVSL